MDKFLKPEGFKAEPNSQEAGKVWQQSLKSLNSLISSLKDEPHDQSYSYSCCVSNTIF